MTPSGGIRGRLTSIIDIQILAAPYYSRIVTLFCDLKKSQKCVTIPSIEGKLRLEVLSWRIYFLLHCIRGPFWPMPCHTYSESLDQSRSFCPWSDHISGQKIGKRREILTWCAILKDRFSPLLHHGAIFAYTMSYIFWKLRLKPFFWSPFWPYYWSEDWQG